MKNMPTKKESTTKSTKSASKTTKNGKNGGGKKISKKFSTHTGHPLTPNEARFIDRYIETSNGMQSVIDAGYNSKAPHVYANTLLNKDYIAEEIRYRMQQAATESVASAEEIMQYFTDVMRGKIKDQFGLEASLGERTKAAQELAKRQIDIPNKLSGNDQPELKITLNWERPEVSITSESGDDGK